MKQLKIFFCFLLFSIVTNCSSVTTYYSIRPQGVDAARELAGWTQHVNIALSDDDQNPWYGTLSVTGEYAHSFNASSITNCLFGTSCPVTISGSHVQNRA